MRWSFFWQFSGVTMDSNTQTIFIKDLPMLVTVCVCVCVCVQAVQERKCFSATNNTRTNAWSFDVMLITPSHNTSPVGTMLRYTWRGRRNSNLSWNSTYYWLLMLTEKCYHANQRLVTTHCTHRPTCRSACPRSNRFGRAAPALLSCDSCQRHWPRILELCASSCILIAVSRASRSNSLQCSL